MKDLYPRLTPRSARLEILEVEVEELALLGCRLFPIEVRELDRIELPLSPRRLDVLAGRPRQDDVSDQLLALAREHVLRERERVLAVGASLHHRERGRHH